MDALIIRAPSINHYQPPYIFQGESEERVRHVYGGLPDQHPAHQESTGAHVRPQLSGNWTISIDFRIENVTLCWFFIISICKHLVRFKLFKLIMVSFLFYLWTFLNYFIYSEPVYFNNIDLFGMAVFFSGFRIRIFFADPDPGKNFDAVPDPGRIRGRGLE